MKNSWTNVLLPVMLDAVPGPTYEGYLPLEPIKRSPGKPKVWWRKRVFAMKRPMYVDRWERVAVLSSRQHALEARNRAHRKAGTNYSWWPPGIWEVQARGKELWVCYRGKADKPIFLRTTKSGRPIKEENLGHRAIATSVPAGESGPGTEPADKADSGNTVLREEASG